MNYLKIFIALNIISSPIYISANYDSEFEKMNFAQLCSNKKSHGFQGCVNRDKCGFNGFYLARYSPEGLCDECEFKEYPERFVACVFCRSPHKKLFESQTSFSCGPCQNFVEDTLLQSTKTNNEFKHTQALSIGAHILLRELKQKSSRKYITAFGSIKTRIAAEDEAKNQRQKQNEANNTHVLGFYLGALILENGNKLHVWIDTLYVDPADKKLVTDYNNAKNHLEYICEKYNLFGPETGEIVLTHIPNGAFTFEEMQMNTD